MWFIIKKDPEEEKNDGSQSPSSHLYSGYSTLFSLPGSRSTGWVHWPGILHKIGNNGCSVYFGQFNKCIVIVTTGDIEFI